MSIEAQIERWIQKAEESGELKKAERYGKPLELGDGFFETPGELRLPFKILKNAGYLPPELELRKRVSELRAQLAAAHSDDDRARLRKDIVDAEQRTAVLTENQHR